MTLPKRLLKKATLSLCRYKVSAVGITSRGNILGYSFNKPRLQKKYGDLHAEMDLIHRYGEKISTIIICRVNDKGTHLLPIEPCEKCAKVAEKLGIKIISLF